MIPLFKKTKTKKTQTPGFMVHAPSSSCSGGTRGAEMWSNNKGNQNIYCWWPPHFHEQI